MTIAATPDWTQGAPRLVLTSCEGCGHSWYLRREHCPVCRAERHRPAEVDGSGLCVGVTWVHVTADGSDDAVGLALVELDQGVVVMGRATQGLRPGVPVRLEFRRDGANPALFPTFVERT
jgi:uncharacterized protein